MAVSNVPDDLIRLTDVLKEYRPKRGWWEIRMERGEIQRYAVPGERGIWLSRADVERMTRPQPYEAVYDTNKDKDAG